MNNPIIVLMAVLAMFEDMPAESKDYRLPEIAKSYKGRVKQNFPAKYLAEPLIFKNIPLTSLIKEKHLLSLVMTK